MATPKVRKEAHDNSSISKLYRPVDRYVKNLIKEVSDVPKEYKRDLDLSERAKFSSGSDKAAAKAAIAANVGRPNQVKEALNAFLGRSPKKAK